MASSLLKKCKVVTLDVSVDGSFLLPHILTVIHSVDFDKIILSSDSEFINKIPSNARAKLSYTDGRDMVTLVGEPELIRDFESDSPTPHTVLLRFRSEVAALSFFGDCTFIDTRPRLA